MDNKYIKDMLSQMDKELASKGLSRRDAMKLAGLSSAGFLMGGTNAQAATEEEVITKHESNDRILIIGGGLSGMSTARRLTTKLNNPDITIIEPNEDSSNYQPGQTLVGGGIWDIDEILFKRDDYLPEGVRLIKEKAIGFTPQKNYVTTDQGTRVEYDYMIIAAGLQMDFERIKGITDAGRVYSSGDNSNLLKVLGDDVCSIFTAEGAERTWEIMQKKIEEAKKASPEKPVRWIFTHPNTPIKCGGAPKKIMNLANARLKDAGVRDNVEMLFCTNGGAMFGIPEYHDAVLGQFKREGFKWNYRHNLIEVHKDRKIAVFDAKWQEKGPWDPIMHEYEVIPKHEKVEIAYDFLHISPPQMAPRELRESDVGSASGWIPVNKETLQHFQYKNIYAIGDVAQVPMGKTGGSVRKQYKVLVDNIVAQMQEKKLPAKYAGYTVCPLITTIGTVMLAEFNWTVKPTPLLPLDPTVERWMWWLMKIYLLKPMTQIGMLQTGKA